MLTLSWRKAGASTALAMVLVVGLPALAQAQLFPNMWIQRQRTPCPNEPPFYAHVRHNYYGYFPTCWSKFPEGWACPCPNPEAPDSTKAFQYPNHPRDPRPEDTPPPELPGGVSGRLPGDIGSAPAPGTGGRVGGPSDALPPIPRSVETSPFNDTGRPSGRDPNAPDTGRPTVPGRGNAPQPTDPFAPLPPSLPRSNGPNSSSLRTPGPANDAPPLDEPAAGTSSLDRPTGSDSLAGESAPVLALPEMATPDGSLPALSPMPASIPPDATTLAAPPAAEPAPAQAPRRPGLLSGLFNWRRR